jgi:hypothetical protein
MGASLRIREHRDEILRVAALHGAGNVRLFGSAARGEDTPESDVDLLVDVTGETTPWFPGSLTADLEQLLGRRVQVVIRRSLSPLIRDAVLREAVFSSRTLRTQSFETFRYSAARYCYDNAVSNIQVAWDRRKALSNLAKHGVSFEEAQTVFQDEGARLTDDPNHSEYEDRLPLLG